MQRLIQSTLMLVCWWCLAFAQAWADDIKAIPTLTDPVMDTAQMMSPDARAQLNQQLLDYSKSKGSQIVVYTVDTTAPEDLFSFGMRVTEKWRLGRAQQNDGVLFLIAKDDRKNQIFVGRGLEGAITDVDAHHILSRTVKPAFQQGDFDGGINAAVTQLQGLIAGEALPEASTNNGGEDEESSWVALLIPMLFVASFFKRMFGSFFGSAISGVLAAGICLFLGVGLLGALGAAVGVFVFSLLLGSGMVVFPSGGGGSDGGSWGGGGYDGGGFSGGGGSFGGGGASGDW